MRVMGGEGGWVLGNGKGGVEYGKGCWGRNNEYGVRNSGCGVRNSGRASREWCVPSPE
ncbi:MAG TPA: hypothetical protein VNM69_19765 [Bacillus sp. (in: firmicutes)]|nr:hypothetical protein [Bacillus sp. (in: firmicutes)]